ncbi:alpha-L-arabinofuranosidase C-terminal domain-containing protein [Saccharothrix isguenensis]
MANLAQLVDVIAPIRGGPGGPAWRQTTFHPFHLGARSALEVEDARTVTVPPGMTRHAANTEHSRPVEPAPPHGVHPAASPKGTTISATLPDLSWSAFQLRTAGGPRA